MTNSKNKDKWEKLEQYLSNLRYHTAPNAHTPDGVRYDRLLQIEVIDRIINHMHVLDKEEDDGQTGRN